MMTRIYASLTIDAKGPVIELPYLGADALDSGTHTQSKFRGSYAINVVGDGYSKDTIVMPQRDRHMTIHTAAAQPSEVEIRLRPLLEEIDVRYETGRQLYRLQQVLYAVVSDLTIRSSLPFTSVINSEGYHSSLSFLTSFVEVYVFGVYDTINTSTRLIFSTDPKYLEIVRASNPTRFVFYRFPTIVNRPLFVYGQSVCSKWLGWIKGFSGQDATMKAFNALENFLFKDPTVPLFGNGARDGRRNS